MSVKLQYPSEKEVTQAFREVFSGPKAALVLATILNDMGFYETDPKSGEVGNALRALSMTLLARLGINHHLNQVLMVEKLLELPVVDGLETNEEREDLHG